MAALQRAGVRPDQVSGLLPVGGSSRIPLVGTLLHQRIGVAPTLIEEPEVVVALGSVRGSAPAPEISASVPVSPIPTSPGPVWPEAPAPPVAAASSMSPTRWRFRQAGIVFFVIVVLSVCLGRPVWQAISKEWTAANSSGQQPGGSGTRGTTPEPPGGRQQRETVNKTAWYAGLKLTFGELRYDAATENWPLVVDVRFENESNDPYSLGGFPVAFRSGTIHFEGRVEIGADVPALAKTDGKIKFRVGELAGPIREGSFVLGGGDRAQAIVPVDDGQLVPNQPTTVLENKQVVIRDLVVTVRRCELRADLVRKQRQADRDHYAFSCVMDARYTGDSSVYFGGQASFRLQLPDGTTVGPTADDLRVVASAVESDVYVAFTFKWPLPGKYTFQIINKSSRDAQTAQNTSSIVFTVP
jgi:hypothetical protein